MTSINTSHSLQSLSADFANALCCCRGIHNADLRQSCDITRIALRRFWEATSGICYRTLQYADSQVSSWTQMVVGVSRCACLLLCHITAAYTPHALYWRTIPLGLPPDASQTNHRSTSSRSRRTNSCWQPPGTRPSRSSRSRRQHRSPSTASTATQATSQVGPARRQLWDCCIWRHGGSCGAA